MNCRDSRPCMETKTFCRCCKTHFYKPEMRGRIRMAICCGGLRMLLYHLHKNCHAPVLYRDFFCMPMHLCVDSGGDRCYNNKNVTFRFMA